LGKGQTNPGSKLTGLQKKNDGRGRPIGCPKRKCRDSVERGMKEKKNMVNLISMK